MHPTNGVQPLIVLFYSICFRLAGDDKWLGVRLTFGLVALFESLCVILIYKAINEFKRQNAVFAVDPALVGAALWTFLLANLIHNAIGLETGLYATLILLNTYLYARILKRERVGKGGSAMDWIVLGISLGLTVLARIDAVFLVAAFVAVDIWRRKRSTLMQRLVPSATIGFVAILISSTWWTYNYTTFGSLMPISGQSESLGNFLAINVGFASTVLANITFILFYLPTDYPPGLISTLIALVVISVLVLAVVRTRLIERLRGLYDLTPLMVLTLLSVAIVLYYTFLFAAPHFIGRYFHPIRTAAIVLAAMISPLLVGYLRSGRVKAAAKVVMAVYLVAGVAFSTVHYVYNFTIKDTSALYWAGVWASQHPQYKLGMTSSGTANFVSGTVVNLDGKVNYDALLARRTNTMGEYIVKSGINVILDMDRPSIEEAEHAGATFVPIDTFKNSIYYLRH